jgi:hypothetical protein
MAGDLPDIAALAGWGTPAARDFRHANAAPRADRHEGRKDDQLNNQVVHLAGWPTLSAMRAGAVDLERLEARREECRERTGNGNGFGLTLDQAAPYLLATQGPARLTATGELRIGYGAAMESGGQLNPALSRWLQALPPAWCDCAVTAMRSMPKRRRR